MLGVLLIKYLQNLQIYCFRYVCHYAECRYAECRGAQGKHSWDWCNHQLTEDIWLMFDLVEFSSLSNPFELCSDHFPGSHWKPGGINKDPTVWLEGAIPPPKYVFTNNISSMN